MKDPPKKMYSWNQWKGLIHNMKKDPTRVNKMKKILEELNKQNYEIEKKRP